MTVSARSSRDSRAWSRWSGIGAALVYLVPLGVLFWLDRPALSKPLWSDEWATWIFSGLGWSQLEQATSHVDRFLLPYYAVVHLARDAGAGITAVRLLSLACGAIAVLATQLVARHIWGRIGALTAGLVLAANPLFCLWVSQARPHAFGYAAVAVGTLLIVRWSRPSAFAYPVVVTIGALLDPTSALAVGPQLFWRWRQAGGRAALRTLGLVAPGVLAVAAWEMLSMRQLPALLVASDAGVDAAWVALDHAVGSKGWLPWVHLAAVVAGVVVTLAHRGAQHRMARDGIWLAILLVEGTLAASWVATLLGVPMLADHLLLSVPIGAALLLAGVIGYPWFPARNADADLGVALRGGFAAATALALILAASWWVDSARSDESVDRMDLVAGALAERTRVGDLLLFQQPYPTGGYTYSLAAAMGDHGLRAALQEGLPSGADTLMVRRVTDVDPRASLVQTTGAELTGDAARVWVIRLPGDPADKTYGSALRCADPVSEPFRVVQTQLDLYRCPR